MSETIESAARIASEIFNSRDICVGPSEGRVVRGLRSAVGWENKLVKATGSRHPSAIFPETQMDIDIFFREAQEFKTCEFLLMGRFPIQAIHIHTRCTYMYCLI